MLNPDFRDILSAFNAERVDVEGIEVPTISRDNLIANKRASGRPQDLADVARLTKPQG